MRELMHGHRCGCGECINGYESDTRNHLARQIGGETNEFTDAIICPCGEEMICEWFVHCGESGEDSSILSTGWNNPPSTRDVSLAQGRFKDVSI